MRIIAGKNKGKKLKSFEGDAIRPTSDRARESLFNILSPMLLGSDFLDLCCGTGAVGIEAISRGAATVDFVDSSKESAKIKQISHISNPIKSLTASKIMQTIKWQRATIKGSFSNLVVFL